MVSLKPDVSTAADWNTGPALSTGVVVADVADSSDGSSKLYAIALNVYADPFVSPVTAQLPPVDVVFPVDGVVPETIQNLLLSSTA
jgi:hypothetical protein